MKIIEVNEFTKAFYEAVCKFLSFLSTDPVQFTEADFNTIITSAHSHLFLLFDGESIAGMATVATYRSPSGSKAWIEDVVVDETCRGKGYGRILTQHAIDFAKLQHADLLMLTSNPSRIAANKLYQSIGFQRKETNLYRMLF